VCESDIGQWFDLSALERLARDEPDRLSWVDAAGVRFHLSTRGLDVSTS